jgi:phytoene synthase
MDKKQLFKKNAKTFSFASVVLPRKTFEKIIIFYEFCRAIDDIADENDDYLYAKKSIENIMIDIKKGYSDSPYLNEFITFIRKEGINQTYIIDLLNGVLFDCKEQIKINNQSELLDYAYAVAGTVGAIMCTLLDIGQKDHKNALLPAIHLGIAMQLTNIARDIYEDAGRNRIYIPQSWKKTVSCDLLVMPTSKNNDVRDECKKLLDLADKYYLSSEAGYPYLPTRARICIFIASNLYRAIGCKIRKDDYQYWKGRVYLDKLEKIKVTLINLRKIFAPYFWLPIKKTDPHLYSGNSNE